MKGITGTSKEAFFAKAIKHKDSEFAMEKKGKKWQRSISLSKT